ncbi:MAG: beta-hexosaminidase [Clostridia bacterium]|nr:beta-hexosaminidase [Clostridia bacterium]
MKSSVVKKILSVLLIYVMITGAAACSTDHQANNDVDTSVSYTDESQIESEDKQESAASDISETDNKKNKETSKKQSSAESRTESKSESSSESKPESRTESSLESKEENKTESRIENTQNSEVTTVSGQNSHLADPSYTEESKTPVEPSRELSQPETSDGKKYKSVPLEWQDDGIFSNNYDRAYKMVQDMTLEQKVGQMILGRCPSENGSAVAKKYHVGGYILFGRDFGYTKTKDEVTGNISSYMNAQKIPMIIAVDEEGGTVSRLQGNYNLIEHDFLSPRELYNNGGMDAIKDDTLEKSQILKSLKINTNLAPVCDISKSEDDFMYNRSLGQNADITADFVKNVTKISQENGISAALKHFPGYGNNVDTHTGIAIDKRTYETFEKNDFIPFKAGIDAGAHMVLVSHNIVECMDKDYPASLSTKVHEILRNKLGFTGIIITDDLAMDAISVYVKGYSPVVAAVLAGNDMLCVSDIEGTYDDVLNAVHTGKIEVEQIDHAVMRILAWKMSKNLM